ncbi:MAG: hypothetical protein KJ077_40280 [Anaerolineae bacterium]|nr:hypothetical protein [Anaerolineae bacterium]
MTYEQWLASVPQELTNDPLFSIIPVERGYKLMEERLTYDIDIRTLLDNPPMP